QQYDNNGIGLDNVISRLRLYAERRDVVEIHSQGENTGCEFIVRIPRQKKEANNVQSDDRG
ncbi:MAG: histidine kinase, partial [Butyrivibrio sp.]|nr:histidine kinase [Butyrivibrio sp.]